MTELARMNLTTLVLKSEHVIRTVARTKRVGGSQWHQTDREHSS
jgi:hypothetical protein